jgi:hypothetical protein
MSRARKVNDDSLEWLIMVARVGSVALAAMTPLWLVIAVLSGISRAYVAALVLGVCALGAGWFGWVRYGNEEWTQSGRTSPVLPLCGARWNDQTCARLIARDGRHIQLEGLDEGVHHDEVHDPQRERTWV